MVKIVEKLHKSGYIHGDITPSNFVIPKDIDHLKSSEELDDVSSENADNYKRLKLQQESQDVLFRYQ